MGTPKSLYFLTQLHFMKITRHSYAEATATRKSEALLFSSLFTLLHNLSILDICFSPLTAPKVLVDLLPRRKTISFNGCITQMFFFHLLGGADIFSLCDGL